mmetsp:Transcript_97987/g.169737  ORF Transcript_97987/g.169737 Transcript_97987/m.169737 type:complete len:472 (-) Transcript_97987:67-1482(-)
MSYLRVAILARCVTLALQSSDCQPQCIAERGVCVDGRCFCRSPWGGSDCSVNVLLSAKNAAAPATRHNAALALQSRGAELSKAAEADQFSREEDASENAAAPASSHSAVPVLQSPGGESSKATAPHAFGDQFSSQDDASGASDEGSLPEAVSLPLPAAQHDDSAALRDQVRHLLFTVQELRHEKDASAKESSQLQEEIDQVRSRDVELEREIASSKQGAVATSQQLQLQQGQLHSTGKAHATVRAKSNNDTHLWVLSFLPAFLQIPFMFFIFGAEFMDKTRAFHDKAKEKLGFRKKTRRKKRFWERAEPEDDGDNRSKWEPPWFLIVGRFLMPSTWLSGLVMLSIMATIDGFWLYMVWSGIVMSYIEQAAIYIYIIAVLLGLLTMVIIEIYYRCWVPGKKLAEKLNVLANHRIHEELRRRKVQGLAYADDLLDALGLSTDTEDEELEKYERMEKQRGTKRAEIRAKTANCC